VLAAPIPILVLLTVVPYVAFRQLRGGALSGRWLPDPVWSLLVLHAVLTAVNLVGFVLDGGGFHDRYLMTVMPLLATVTALGMVSVRETWDDWRAATAWAAVLLAWLACAFTYQEWYYIFNRQDESPVEGPVPVMLLAVAAAIGVLAVAVLARRASLPIPEPVLAISHQRAVGRS